MAVDYTLYYLCNGGKRETNRLLPLAVSRHAGGGDWTPSRTEQGKPCFPQAPNIHVSVTHSGEYWMCAIGPRPVGLDLQEHRAVNAERISERFFHPEEAAFLRSMEYRCFFDVWAAKESYGKYTGDGLRGMERFSVTVPTGLRENAGGAQLRVLPFREGYSLCICAESLGEIRMEAL